MPRLLAWVLFLVVPGWGATKVVAGTKPGLFIITGTILTPDKTIRGSMVIRDGTIECVEAHCPAPAGATRIWVKNAYILPGFIDAHQHLPFNFMPRWKNTRVYPNRYEWQRDADYLAFLAPQRKFLQARGG